jgi:hypothetical protein
MPSLNKYVELHNNFESFVVDLTKALSALEETSEQIIKDIIIEQTKSHYFKPAEEKSKKRPPQAKSSYMFFVEAMRPTLVAENPKASTIDIAKLCGERWNALGDEGKKPYNKLHQDMKEAMANGTYVAPVKPEKAKKNKKGAANKATVDKAEEKAPSNKNTSTSNKNTSKSKK